MAKSKKSTVKTQQTTVEINNISHGIAKKHITFFERLSQDHTSLCRCRLCSCSVVTQPVSAKVFDEKLQRSVTVTQHKVVDNKSFLSQFKVSDFDMQTLIDTGALASMSSYSLSGDNFTAIANVGRMMDSLDNSCRDQLNQFIENASNINS